MIRKLLIFLVSGLIIIDLYMQADYTRITTANLIKLADIQHSNIILLNDKITLLDQNIEALQSQNKDLLYLIAGVNTEVTKLKEQIQNKTDYITELEGQLLELNDRFFLIETVWSELNFDRFIATAYSPFDNVSGIENDGDPWSTSTGTVPGPGTFAVCPETIPYYSLVTVIGDGWIEHGQALDTGATMRRFGTWVDIYKDTYLQTLEFGLQRDVIVIWQESEIKR